MEAVPGPFSLLPEPPLTNSVSFDLHGYRRKAAREAVGDFFEQAKKHQYDRMTIITGRGNHVNSNGSRGVLFHSMPKWLEQPEIKRVIKSVKQDMGAYEITLKNDKQDKMLESAKEVVKAAAPILFPPEQIEFIRKKAAEGSPGHQYLLGGLMVEGYLGDQDVKEGMKLIQQGATGGDQFAQMQLGLYYGMGKGVPQDYKLSRKWHEKASENDAQPYSLFVLGQYYWIGQGVIQNDVLALDYLTRAAKLKEPTAAHNLGRIYLDGTETMQPDGASAQKYLLQAAQSGVLESKVLLAKQYFFGWGDVPCDFEQARHWFLEAANEGDPVAEYYLGRIYSEGKKVLVDQNVAFGWFQKSAEQGDIDAKQTVACALIEGKGVPKDHARGMRELKALAESGHLQAAATLGQYFLVGHVKAIPKNPAQARHYLRMAAEGGYIEAQKILYQICLFSKSEFANQEEGERWLRKAAAQNDGEALCHLAYFLETTTDRQTTKKEILDCYLRAAKKNHPEALYLLGLSYLEGDIVDKDETLARSTLERAAKAGHVRASFDTATHLMKSGDPEKQKRAMGYLSSIANVYPPAQACLGFCYRDGLGVKKDPQQSFKWFEKAANNKDSKDPFVLYIMGDLCSQRNLHERSFNYFLEASNAGMEAADFKVAQCYVNGTGVQRNIPKAIPWLQKCLMKGVKEAGQILCEIYQKGGVGAVQSLQALKTAAEAGIPAAQALLISLAMENSALAKPARWMDVTANQGDIAIQFMLAGLYYMNRNGAKAVELFKKVIAGQSSDPQAIEGQAMACDYMDGFCQSEEERYFYKRKALEFNLKISGDPEHQYRIGCLYYQLEEDLTLARLWLQKAASQNHPEAKQMLAQLPPSLAITPSKAPVQETVLPPPTLEPPIPKRDEVNDAPAQPPDSYWSYAAKCSLM